MDFHIIIPARFASQRLPGKVLREVGGKTLIQHVYERAILCNAKSITLAVDDERVKVVAESFGAKICMTGEHSTGSDRLSEAASKLQIPDQDIIVNIQGDEPLIAPLAVHQAVKAMMANKEASVTTLCTPIHRNEEILDPNVVKVVLDKSGFALYFSRSPIPYERDKREVRDTIKNSYYRHIGLYAYRAKTLRKYSEWERSSLEEIEKLEQLRILWHGEKIHVSIIEDLLPAGIDTEADLENFRASLQY